MNVTQEKFLSILKQFVKGQPAELTPNTDTNELLKLGQIHGLTPVLGYALNNYVQKASGVDENLQTLSEVFIKTVMVQYNRIWAFEDLLDVLNQNKIKVVLMKGCVFNKYYPEKEIRTFGDIDFLVHPNDLAKLHGIMLSLGYEHNVAEKTVWGYNRGREKYEVHTALMPNEEALSDELKAFISGAYSSCLPTDRKYVFVLEPSYHFVFSLIHIAKHMRETGAGARMYLDLALMLKNEKDLNFDYIKNTATKIGFGRFLNFALHLCERWFGVKANMKYEPVDESAIISMEEYVVSAGVFGFYDRNPAVARIRNSDKGVSKISALKKFVFPSYKDMRGGYAFLDGRPYLLPVVWIIRAFDGVFLRRKKASKIFVGMFTEGENAKATAKMLEDIGLGMKLK